MYENHSIMTATQQYADKVGCMQKKNWLYAKKTKKPRLHVK